MKTIERVIAFLSKLSAWISGIFVILMILLITLEVTGRKLFGFSTLVSDEFSGYMLALITFMGAAYTVKTEGFTRMELIYLRFKGKGRWVFNVVINLIALVFLLIVDYWIWVFVLSSYRAETKSISIVQTPLFIPQIFMGLGVTLLVFEVILQFSLSLLGGDRKGLEKA
jgi:TRAP-type C4-dicarboxylate transport system permease small subunit